MKISARIKYSGVGNQILLSTEGKEKTLEIPSKPEGTGLSTNGGELLFLSIATCVCNDLYREGARRNIILSNVEVQVSGKFEKEGEGGKDINYQVRIESPNSDQEISDLISYVDQIAEINRTIREGTPITLINGLQV